MFMTVGMCNQAVDAYIKVSIVVFMWPPFLSA